MGKMAFAEKFSIPSDRAITGTLFEIFRYCLPPARPSLRLGLSTSLRSGLAVCRAYDQRMRIKRIENGENKENEGI